MSWLPHFGQLRVAINSGLAVICLTNGEIEAIYSKAYSIFPDLSAIDVSQKSTLR
jgi:hypothetical protein